MDYAFSKVATVGNYATLAKGDVEGVTGIEETETEKSTTVLVKDGDGPLPPPKSVSPYLLA
jgi:hypothetical protein